MEEKVLQSPIDLCAKYTHAESGWYYASSYYLALRHVRRAITICPLLHFSRQCLNNLSLTHVTCAPSLWRHSIASWSAKTFISRRASELLPNGSLRCGTHHRSPHESTYVLRLSFTFQRYVNAVHPLHVTPSLALHIALHTFYLLYQACYLATSWTTWFHTFARASWLLSLFIFTLYSVLRVRFYNKYNIDIYLINSVYSVYTN